MNQTTSCRCEMPTAKPLLEYTYTGNRPRGIDAQGYYGGTNTNLLKIWQDGKNVIIARYYNGDTSKNPIVGLCNDWYNIHSLAKHVHWCCCGQLSDLSTIHPLIDELKKVISI